MKKHSTPFIILATSFCIIACIGDFAVTFILGFFFPNYNFINQSESFLGTANSPVAFYMNAWGVVFSILFCVYAYALRKTIFESGKWQQVAVWLIVIYGLGEGAGSGLFPYDHIGNALTVTAIFHSIFSETGDAAMVILPFVFMKIFPKYQFPKMHRFAFFVLISGPILIIIFSLARAGYLNYKGLWQRLFILDYYLLLIAVAIDMLLTHFSLKTKI